MTRLLAAAVAAVSLLALAGCAENPATGQPMFNMLSPDQERQLGAREHESVLEAFGGAYADPALQDYVDAVGQRLARHGEGEGIAYTFTVLDSPVVNAMALPGGYVYVTRGLLALADSEAELASVLGHEIGHVVARHAGQRVSQSLVAGLGLAILGAAVDTPELVDVAGFGAQAYLQSYSRGQEHEADDLGIRYMVQAGYDPQASAALLRKLHAQARLEARLAGRDPDSVDAFNIMATHPRALERVQRVAQAAAPGTAGQVERGAYLGVVDGLVYGARPEDGLVRGRSFVHPVLRFRFEVPEGFDIVNSDEAVYAGDGSGNVVAFDGARWRGTDMAAYLQGVWATGARLQEVERITVNGLPAATGTTRVQLESGARDARLVAIGYGEGQVYRFIFLTRPDMTEALALPLRRTTYSFEPLDAEAAGRVRPYRLRVHTVQAGETAAALAARFPHGDGHELERFRVLNGLAAGEEPAPGRRVKLVVE